MNLTAERSQLIDWLSNVSDEDILSQIRTIKERTENKISVGHKFSLTPQVKKSQEDVSADASAGDFNFLGKKWGNIEGLLQATKDALNISKEK